MYWLLKILLTPLIRLLWRFEVEGELPRQGAAIIAANHSALSDAVFLAAISPRRISFAAKAELFRSFVTRIFLRSLGQVPMPRDGGDSSHRALQVVGGVLAKGGLIGIFPEGTLTPDGRVWRGRTGVARLAIATGAPIVPVGVCGLFDLHPPGRWFARPGTIRIRIGDPLDPGSYTAAPNHREAIRHLTDRVMHEIAALTGQEYVDTYIQRKKRRRAGEQDEPGHEPSRPQESLAAGSSTTGEA